MRGLVALLLLAACPAAAAQEPSREQLEEELDAYRRVLMDWGGLTRYGSDNAELKLDPHATRVVFLGDELTEQWPDFFPGKPHYLNRGITRQTAAQMLVRFRQDVIGLKPKVVVIQAGGNDLARVMGPVSEGTLAEFIESMVDLAKAHQIRVVLASLTPVCDCHGREDNTKRRPVARILATNRWLERYARDNGLVYLDYFTPLAQGRLLNPALTSDGLLPNRAGYALLAPLAEKAIAEALTR